MNKLCLLAQKNLPVEKVAIREQISVEIALNKIHNHFAEVISRYEAIKNLHFIDVNSCDNLYVNHFAVLKSLEKLNLRI